MKRKNGFTLVEMLIVVVLIGAILMIGWPKVAAGLAKANLRSSRTTVANMFAKARAFAMQSNRTTSINFNGNNVVITAPPRTLARHRHGGLDRRGREALRGLRRDLHPTPASVTYDPRGIRNLGTGGR